MHSTVASYLQFMSTEWQLKVSFLIAIVSISGEFNWERNWQMTQEMFSKHFLMELKPKKIAFHKVNSIMPQKNCLNFILKI